ncbi:hypothetical protein ACFQMM_22385 [Saliphagus sp. GCM10025308]
MSHIDAENDEQHNWGVLGFENGDRFQYESHVKTAERLQETAQEARDSGQYRVAVEKLEKALWHLQQAGLLTDEVDRSIEARRRTVFESISDVETDRVLQKLDDLVNRAENACDAGDQLSIEEDAEAATHKYEESIESLKEATELASDVAPDRVSKIEDRLRRVEARRHHLESSDWHRELLDLVTRSRQRTATGNAAFQASEYEGALEAYEAARERYDEVEVLFEQGFDEPTAAPDRCDVCGCLLEDDIEPSAIEVDGFSQVCPSCAQFGPDGTLPTPDEVRTERRYVEEDIESIRSGDVGLTWAPESTSSGSESDNRPAGGDRDARQMTIQLVGVVQQIGRVPTPQS